MKTESRAALLPGGSLLSFLFQMIRQMKLFPRPLKATYRVLPGQIFVHPRTKERITEGVDFVADDSDVADQIYKLVRRPIKHRAILNAEFARGSDVRSDP